MSNAWRPWGPVVVASARLPVPPHPERTLLMKTLEASLTRLNDHELANVTGGMTPGVAWKIWTTSTKMGLAAEDEQPAFKARQEPARKAQTAAAVNQMKTTTPHWPSILQPSPFAPKGPTVPPALLQPANPGHPQMSKGQ